MTSLPFLPAQDPPRSHLRTNTAQRSLDLGKSHISRRHAGSFSSKDVEIGKMLPSYVGAPPFNFGVVNGLPLQIPPTRTMRRIAVSPAQHTPDGILPQSSSMKPWTTHSRQGSQNSLLASSSSSSSGLLGARQEPSSSTNTLVDKEVIGAMKLAVEAAPALWEMMDEIIDESSDTKDDMNEALMDGRTLHDDAHIFVKTVIQLSNAIKTHGAARPLSSPLRTNMVKLTNATQEFVMLLHVSSYSPRPYSPMVSLMAQPTLGCQTTAG
ncbi:hypothetical protein A0H81_10818 [Grifola frondosa]|uniref:Uncharacterized protein n=1 Tax=Grifola frondosa TaxID=5627 RepID=A0A1C7LX17_GRIFR|nr:hypothetical protein A0H81_10818 [Grifola frondosa]